jgi:energy-coupling factor transporter transmembrane protein EcfT
MIRKIGLFLLSLWLLFVLIILITAKIPLDVSLNAVFVGWRFLAVNNIIPIFCLIALIIGYISSYRDFIHQIKGTPELSFKVKEIEKIDYEHLTFLTTYIIPLVGFQFDNLRYIFAFLIILFVIGSIYIRTDLFYANPTLAILNFRIYKVSGEFRNREARQNKILISKDLIEKEDRVKYYKLDERIYYATKVNSNE